MTTAKRLDQDLIEHACTQLTKAARRRVHEGMGSVGPATAAWAAIKETKALFPADWRLGVQGDDGDDHVEVWEVDHKWQVNCAHVDRYDESEAEPAPARRTRKRRGA